MHRRLSAVEGDHLEFDCSANLVADQKYKTIMSPFMIIYQSYLERHSLNFTSRKVIFKAHNNASNKEKDCLLNYRALSLISRPRSILLNFSQRENL